MELPGYSRLHSEHSLDFPLGRYLLFDGSFSSSQPWYDAIFLKQGIVADKVSADVS